MSFDFVEKVTSSGAGSAVLTPASTPTEGQLLIICGGRDPELNSTTTLPSGFAFDVSYEVNNRACFIASKVASASEPATYTVLQASGQGISLTLEVWDMNGLASVGTGVTAASTNASSVSVGPITPSVGDLCIAAAFFGSATHQSWSNSFINSGEGGGSGYKIQSANKIAASTSESTTHTLTSSTLRQSAALINYVETAVLSSIIPQIMHNRRQMQ
tara:strand:+ start:34 stop:681 length:648 start_codon:yes stop_codon:yes gene_type:complete